MNIANVGFLRDAHDAYAADSILYVAEANQPTIGIHDMSDPTSPKGGIQLIRTRLDELKEAWQAPLRW